MSTLIALAAGGTGGHMFPAVALAKELHKQGYKVAVLTDPRGSAFEEKLPDADVYKIEAAQLGGGIKAKIKGVLSMFKGTRQARKLLKKIKPTLIIGFGGYSCVPPLAAAKSLGIPIMLHEQNAVFGRANRLFEGAATKLATTFPIKQDNPKTTRTGLPVRPEIADLRLLPYQTPDKMLPLNILVTGGSQGAAIFSQIVPKALAMLPDDLKKRIKLSFQARPELEQETKEQLLAFGIEAEVSSFFHDMDKRLGWAHLVICRAGASTIAEITTAGRPAIYVPYPYAMDDHQTKNAEFLDTAQAGWLMKQDDFTVQNLAGLLQDLLSDPKTLSTTAQAARDWGIDDATYQLAQCTKELAA